MVSPWSGEHNRPPTGRPAAIQGGVNGGGSLPLCGRNSGGGGGFLGRDERRASVAAPARLPRPRPRAGPDSGRAASGRDAPGPDSPGPDAPGSDSPGPDAPAPTPAAQPQPRRPRPRSPRPGRAAPTPRRPGRARPDAPSPAPPASAMAAPAHGARAACPAPPMPRSCSVLARPPRQLFQGVRRLLERR
eukprot:XP_020407735.1 basic proline-rich protein-like [Zea mays]